MPLEKYICCNAWATKNIFIFTWQKSLTFHFSEIPLVLSGYYPKQDQGSPTSDRTRIGPGGAPSPDRTQIPPTSGQDQRVSPRQNQGYPTPDRTRGTPTPWTGPWCIPRQDQGCPRPHPRQDPEEPLMDRTRGVSPPQDRTRVWFTLPQTIYPSNHEGGLSFCTSQRMCKVNL